MFSERPKRLRPLKGNEKKTTPISASSLVSFGKQKDRRMKSVLVNVSVILAGLWLAGEAQAQATYPPDSLNRLSGVSRDVSLDEVVVTAVRAVKGTPVAYSNLSKEELKQKNDGQGIPYLISLSPSVIMTSDAGTGIGYAGFRIRGTDANRINITFNGVPVNDSESHGVFWANMADIASSVESIQIQRGAGTSTNGAGAFGATVAMAGEKPSPSPSAEYSISAGSFGTVKHTAKGGTGLLYDHFAFDARYSHIRSDGYIDRARARMSSYFASAAFYGGSTVIKFQAFGNSETTYQAWTGVPSDRLETDRTYNPCGAYEEDGVVKFYPNQTDNYWQHHYHLSFGQQLGKRWNTNLTLHYTDGNGYYEDYKAGAKYAAYRLPNATDADGNEIKKTDLVRRKWLDNDFYGAIYTLSFGGQRLQTTLGAAANRYAGDHFGRVMWVKRAASLPQPDYEYYRNKGEKTDYNGYVKANYRFGGSFNGYADLQYRGIDYTIRGSNEKGPAPLDVNKHWDFFNPKVGLNFQKGPHNAFASFSVANREPNRDNYTEAGPDERPVSEQLFDYEAGYSFTHPRFRLGANLYYMDYTDQLILTGKISEIGEALTSNIPSSYRMGIELTAGVFIADWLQWSGNLTWSQNKIKRFTESIENYDADWNPIGDGEIENYLGTTSIAFSPDLIVHSVFDVRWKGFTGAFRSQFVGRQYLDNTSAKERSIDPYFVNSLQVGYLFKIKHMKELAIDLTVHNLFNAQYETNGWVYSAMVGGQRYTEDGYFTQAGTHAMARLTFRF